MRHGSLFSGIGGFDLASSWMGWENVFHCEWNEFCQRVLKHYWPKAESFTDITKTDFKKYENKVEILTGGFPCQPYSTAGKRLGKDDERHLWPHMLRAIREIKPRWVVGENVLGLVNWNGGLVFEEVQADLEAAGYQVQPYLLPAAGVGAPHQRYRIWFVAHSDHPGADFGLRSDGERKKADQRPEGQPLAESRENDVDGNASDSGRGGLEADNALRKPKGKVKSSGANGKGVSSDTELVRLEHGAEPGQVPGEEGEAREEGREPALSPEAAGGRPESAWENFPTVSPICNGDDGLSERLDGISFPKWRNESIKAGGNAIVPQVAHMIFKSIAEYESLKQRHE